MTTYFTAAGDSYQCPEIDAPFAFNHPFLEETALSSVNQPVISDVPAMLVSQGAMAYSGLLDINSLIAASYSPLPSMYGHSPATNFSYGGKYLMQSRSSEGINELLDRYRQSMSMFNFIHMVPSNRRWNALQGAQVDIVEENTEHILYRSVPKKLLVLFCGRNVISRLLRTIEHEKYDDDLSNPPLTQEIHVPQGSVTHIGIKIMVAWMRRACLPDKRYDLREMKVPENLFAAVTLGRTLIRFGLERDAHRIENVIFTDHFDRPIDAASVEAVYKVVPKTSKWTWKMVEVLKDNLAASQQPGMGHWWPQPKEFNAMFERHPQLGERVLTLELNEAFGKKNWVHIPWEGRSEYEEQIQLHPTQSMQPLPSLIISQEEDAVQSQHGATLRNKINDFQVKHGSEIVSDVGRKGDTPAHPFLKDPKPAKTKVDSSLKQVENGIWELKLFDA